MTEKALGKVAYEALHEFSSWYDISHTVRAEWDVVAAAVVAEYERRRATSDDPVDQRRRSERTDPVYT